jgi:hypothetical protein
VTTQRRWSRAERLADLRQRYNLPRDSVAEAALRLVDAGYSEQDAVTLMRQAVDDAIARQQGYHERWLALADQLVNERRMEVSSTAGTN